ncbi:sensor histidine kinase [Paracoccus aestuariivivens]|uniref:histidine kinase n=1 Tax=Paracoccus aestuariivivens TaxID=1820333 RepID=A0A6L6JCW2_9RHOB|nr:ATP-binding protein [Paracoccus aestuariivivens]MTH79800.1 HAMP domain-containing protein [Paracoccus aestuariivivens]
MTIRLKILSFQFLVTAMLLSVATVTWYYVDRIDYYFDRNRLAGAQLDSVIRMSAAMNRYSENVAELLLLGRTELEDFNDARSSLEASLDLLETLIRDEIALVVTPSEGASEERELERVAQMRQLYEDIDMRTQRLLLLRDQGRLDEAVQIFREEIEEKLDTTLEVHISAAIADEEAELRQYQTLTNRLERELEWIIGLVTAAAFLISAAAAGLLSRSLTRPIKALESATKEIAEGNLAYRIGYRGRDEFASLAGQIDNAASRLEVQRTALLDVQAGLEHEVGRRTGELEEANTRLHKLDQMRVLFLADIGHELRTPLTVIRGEAEIALRGASRTVDEHRDTLERIVHLCHQMTRLVEDLLFLARAEVDAIRFDMQPLDLKDVLGIILSDAEILAEANDIRIDARMSDEPCLAMGDAGRLAQALMIVLDNAIKYADPATTVRLDLSRVDGGARFVIQNHGPDIPAAELPFVFSRFYRARQSGPRKQSGTGLGLSIAKWIVEGHRGEIEISSVDHLTSLRIWVPLRS